MVIKSISLQNYRNYRTLSLDFDPDTNIFYGDNAQGKTNILEAVYVSGTSRSHRSSKDRELICFSEEEAIICTVFEKKGFFIKSICICGKIKQKGLPLMVYRSEKRVNCSD